MRDGPVLVAVMEEESGAVMQSLGELVISTCPLLNDRTPLIILHALIGDSQPLHLIISAGRRGRDMRMCGRLFGMLAVYLCH